MGDLMRPPPRRSLLEHAVAVLRWIGIGRLAAIGASVLAVAAGSFWLLRTPGSASPDRAAPTATAPAPTVPSGSGTAPGSPEGAVDPPATSVVPTSAPHVVVHVAGAVAAPGIYTLGAASRVADAVDAAGGALGDAALDSINLAAPLADGQQVYVPHTAEATGPAPPGSAPPAAPGPAAAGPLDLNTATEEELLDLPGVGPVLAAAIVRHREEAGPFTSVDGLLDVAGIGPARLESLRDLVRV